MYTSSYHPCGHSLFRNFEITAAENCKHKTKLYIMEVMRKQRKKRYCREKQKAKNRQVTFQHVPALHKLSWLKATPPSAL